MTRSVTLTISLVLLGAFLGAGLMALQPLGQTATQEGNKATKTHIPTNPETPEGKTAQGKKQTDDPALDIASVTLFKNVKVFNGKDNRLYDLDVLVVGNKIKKVGKNIPSMGTYEVDARRKVVRFTPVETGLSFNNRTDAYTLRIITDGIPTKKVKVPVNVIDGGGRTLMPGLIDSHVHLTHVYSQGGVKGFEAETWEEIAANATAGAKEYLMNGFTTVRDMGGMGTGIKRAIDRGLVEGPRVYAAGAYITQTSGHADLRLRSQPNALLRGINYSNLERLNIIRIADGVPSMLTAVRENFAEGAAYIKIHAGGGVTSERDPLHTIQYTPAELRAANQAVKNWDTYWTVHAYNTPTVKQALDAGAKCIDHAQMVDEATVKRMADEGIFLSTHFASMSEEILNKHPVYSDKASPVYQKSMAFLDGPKHFVKYLKKHKPKRVFASDPVFMTPVALRRFLDFEKRENERHFGAFDSLKAMTSVAGDLAALTGKNNPYPGKLGVVEEGAYADLLLVDGNPLRSLSVLGANPKFYEAAARSANVKTIRIIMKDGKFYKNSLK